jgi:quinol monooxygenase YgiN
MMYGTIARMRIKHGAEAQFKQIVDEIESVVVPGQIASFAYQMDRDSHEFYLAVVFESRETYHANAQSPEQHQRFLQLMAVLETTPEWNDGEIVYSMTV